MKSQKYFIVDWASNFLCSAPMQELEFDTSADAWAYINETWPDEEDLFVISEADARDLRRRTKLA